jgi:hypothetical protein
VQRRATAAVLGGICLLGVGCSGNDGERPEQSPADSATTELARVKHLRAGERAVVVRLDRVGRLIVRCDGKGRAASTFVADRLLPTTSLVVERSGSQAVSAVIHPEQRFSPPPMRKPAIFETWQIAPFAKGNVRVATIWLAMGPAAGEPFYSCDASARAAVTLP